MSGTLPAWIERLFGVESGTGEGVVWNFEHSWHWAPWATLLLFVLMAAYVVTIYLRENRAASKPYRLTLAAIRLGLLAILLTMIAHVVLSLHRTGLPYVAVLVDDSLSMSIVDRYDGATGRSVEAQIAEAGMEERPACRR